MYHHFAIFSGFTRSKSPYVRELAVCVMSVPLRKLQFGKSCIEVIEVPF